MDSADFIAYALPLIAGHTQPAVSQCAQISKPPMPRASLKSCVYPGLQYGVGMA